eukprot:2444786-Alexandrium_andersonii.AAC.1
MQRTPFAQSRVRTKAHMAYEIAQAIRRILIPFPQKVPHPHSARISVDAPRRALTANPTGHVPQLAPVLFAIREHLVQR